MVRGKSPSEDDRAASTVLTIVLLVGITLVGVVAVIATGWVSINNANQQANMEVAEESMLQIDSAFQQSSGSNTTVTIPSDVEGQVSVSNDANYTLRLNENRNCSTGPQELSSVQYESNGQTVAYQGGGVWQTSGSGASMTSPPDITYNDGSLSMSFIQITGQVSAGETLQTTANASAQQSAQRNLTLALYTDVSYENVTDGSVNDFTSVCEPGNIDNATLLIEDSQYSRAWAEWARDNYDSPQVTTNASGTVEPGDTVRIQFMLGDVSNPYFNVSNVSYSRANNSVPVEVTAMVENTGGLAGTQSVDLSYAGSQNSTTVSLDPDERTNVTLYIDGDNLTSGTNPITVEGNNSVSRQIEISATPPEDAAPAIELSVDESISSTVQPDAEANGSVEVRNGGNMTTTESITLLTSGAAQETWNVTLNGSESEIVYINSSIPTDGDGDTDDPIYDRTLNVTGDIANNSQTINRTYTIADPSSFEIDGTSDPGTVNEGEDVDITADIRNTGDRTATAQVSVEIEGPGGTEIADTTTDYTISPDSTQTTNPATANDVTAGEYQYTIETPNETQSGSFYVDIVPQEDFEIRSTSIPDRARAGTTEPFTVAVENNGRAEGTQNITVVHDDTDQVIAYSETTIDAQSVEYVEWDVDLTDPPFYANETNDLTINTDNDTEDDVAIELFNTSVIRCEEGSCTNRVGVEAEIVLEGVEEEGYDYIEVPESTAEQILPYGCWGSECYVPASWHTPIRMDLVLTNETTGAVTEESLWEDEPGDGNLNHPEAEAALIDDETVFNRTITLPPNTSVSFNATRYSCNEWDRDDVTVHQNIEPWNYYHGVADFPCVDEGQPLVSTESDEDTLNVATFEDGDEVIGFQAAGAYQIPLDQMVDGQVNDSTDPATYDLRTGERLYTMELTDEVDGAEYSSAEDANAANSAYDYNDAVVRYRRVDIVRNISTPPRFEVGYIEGPNRVDQGDTAEFNVTIRNTGGLQGETDVNATGFDGTVTGNESVTLDAGASTNVTFEFDTTGLADGSYDYTFDARANRTEQADQSGSLFVGQLNTGTAELEPSVQAVGGVTAIDDDESATALVEVYNIGNVDLSSDQTVTLTVEDESGTVVDQVDRTVLSGLSPSDEPQEITIDLPSSQGDYSYYAEVDGRLSGTQSLFVGNSQVELQETDPININGIAVGNTTSRINEDGGTDAIQVDLRNTGTIGDERTVRLSITNASDQDAFSGEQTVDFASSEGEINRIVYRSADFDDASLPPGFYTYEITVLEDGDVDNSYTGEMFLRNTSDGVTTSEDSPVEVDPPTTVTASD